MGSVNDKLKSSISKARSAVQGKGVHFDFVPGSGGGVLLIADSGALAEAKKETKSSTVISGVCYTHEGALIFETKNNPPATLASQIQKCLKDHAGFTSKVEARSSAEMEEQEHESENEQDVSHQPVDAAKSAKITTHVKTLTAKLTGNLANSNAGKAVKTKIAEANAAYKKGDLDAAEKLLTQGDNLLKEEQEHEEESEEPNQEKPDAGKRAERVAKITAHVKTITTKVASVPASSDAAKQAKDRLAKANAAYKNGDLDEAESLLDESEQLLK